MAGPGKKVAEQIVNFLRKNGGEADISGREDATEFGCHFSCVHRILKRLISVGVVKKLSSAVYGERPARYALNEGFKEGDSWRELLKRQSKTEKAEKVGAKPIEIAQPIQAGGDGKNSSAAILELSRELLKVYAELENTQNEVIRLGEKVRQFEEDKKALQTELNAEMQTQKRQIEDIVELSRQLQEARIRKQAVQDRIQTLRAAGLN